MTNKTQIENALAQCEAQLSAAMRVLPLRSGEKKTATEYKITFLSGKVAKLKEFLGSNSSLSVSGVEYKEFANYVAFKPKDQLIKVDFEIEVEGAEVHVDYIPGEHEWDEDGNSYPVEDLDSFPGIKAAFESYQQNTSGSSDWSYRRAEAGYGE